MLFENTINKSALIKAIYKHANDRGIYTLADYVDYYNPFIANGILYFCSRAVFGNKIQYSIHAVHIEKNSSKLLFGYNDGKELKKAVAIIKSANDIMSGFLDVVCNTNVKFASGSRIAIYIAYYTDTAYSSITSSTAYSKYIDRIEFLQSNK